MSNNVYRTVLGVILVVSLYFEVELLIYAMIGILLFEGATNLRIPKLVNRLRKIPEDALDGGISTRFSFEAERSFRLALGGGLLATYPLGSGSLLWFFPWFMGFAILGAGVSGLCPVVALFKWLGFR